MIFILHMKIALFMNFLNQSMTIRTVGILAREGGINIGTMSKIDDAEQLLSTFLLQQNPIETL